MANLSRKYNLMRIKIAGLNKMVKITLNGWIVDKTVQKANIKGFELGTFYKKSAQALLLLLLFATYSISCSAEDFFTNFRWDGYISQSLIHTTDNNFFGKSDDDISLDFTEIELLLSTTFLRDFQFSGSLLSRRAGDSDNGEIRVDHGFINYTIFNDLDWMFSSRVGRIKYPIGFYGETRDIAFTRPSILLPQVIYIERFRGLLYTTDGIGFTVRRSWGLNDITLDLVHATFETEPDHKYFDELLLMDVNGDISQNLSGAARVIYSHDGGRIRVGFTYGSIDYDISNMATQYGEQNINIFSGVSIISAEYISNKFEIISEYAMLRNEVKDAFPFPDVDTKGLTYYIQGKYRISDKWELLLRGEVLHIDKDDKYGKDFEYKSGNTIDGHTRYSKSALIGVGWHISSSMLARLEYSYIEGTGWLPLKDNTNGNLGKYWDMVMAQISYRF